LQVDKLLIRWLKSEIFSLMTFAEYSLISPPKFLHQLFLHQQKNRHSYPAIGGSLTLYCQFHNPIQTSHPPAKVVEFTTG